MKLTESHVKEVMICDILIACDTKIKKKMTFNPWYDEYTVTFNGVYVTGGQALEDIIEIYNTLGE